LIGKNLIIFSANQRRKSCFSSLKQDFLMKSSAKRIRFRLSSILNAYLQEEGCHQTQILWTESRPHGVLTHKHFIFFSFFLEEKNTKSLVLRVRSFH